MMAWWILLAAGLCEVAFTTCLKYSDDFRALWPSLGFFFFSILSFALLNRAIQEIPLGTAYAVWTGIGACGTALIGMLFFKEDAGLLRIALLLGLVACTLGLKFLAHPEKAAPPAPVADVALEAAPQPPAEPQAAPPAE